VDISARAGRKQAAAKSSVSGRECERDSDERQHGQVKHRFSHRLAAIDRLADHRSSGYPNARANADLQYSKVAGIRGCAVRAARQSSTWDGAVVILPNQGSSGDRRHDVVGLARRRTVA
jgi:hypothetical protein